MSSDYCVIDICDIIDTMRAQLHDRIEDLEYIYAEYQEFLSKCKTEHEVERAEDIMSDKCKEWIEDYSDLLNDFIDILSGDARSYKETQLDNIRNKRFFTN